MSTAENKKISQLTALTTSEDTDLLVVMDVSADETKKQTKENFLHEVQGEIDDHLSDTDNPHQTTAEQVGADVAGSASAVQDNLDDHIGDTDNPHEVTKEQVGLGNVPDLDTTDAVNNEHTHDNKSTLDLISEAFTTLLKSAYDGAVSLAHSHDNKSILDQIEEAFTTTLKSAYDSAYNWVTSNGENVVNHLSDTDNPHSVTKTQVGLGNVLDAEQIPASEKGANNGVAELDAGGKVPIEQLPNSIMEFKGVWNATTNNPTLADGTGDIGDVYWTTVAGTQNLGSGPITFAVGDFIIYNGSIWQKSINSNDVVSVNGQQGVVILDTSDIADTLDKRYLTESERLLIASAIQPGENAITILTTASVIDDNNVDFVFTQEPTLICMNGANYRKGYGWTWTPGTLTATITIGPVGVNGDIFGII